MELKTEQSNIIISGQIKTMEDYKSIKKIINHFIIKGQKQFTLLIEDSLSLPSSVIGLLLKAVNQDNAEISIKANNPELILLLTELNLINQFKVIPND